MAFSFKKFWAGINIIPKTTSTADTKGDLDVTESSGKLNYHNGVSASPVVTEDHSATLENKTIVVENNTVTTLPSGNLTETELNSALAQLESQIAGVSGDKISGPASSTANALVRFDGVTGKLAKNSSVTLDDTGVLQRDDGLVLFTPNGGVVVTTKPNSKVGITYGIEHSGSINNTPAVISTAGSNLAISLTNASTFLLTAATSIDTILPFSSSYNGQEITLINASANPITINNETGAITGARVNTGTGGNIILRQADAIKLSYTTAILRWSVNGSVFKGPATSVDNTIPRFDSTTGQVLQSSNVVITDLDEITGASKVSVGDLSLQSGLISTTLGGLTITSDDSDISIYGNLNVSGATSFDQTVDNTTTGSDSTISVTSTRHIKLTNSSLVSISMITPMVDYQELIISNFTGNKIVINNDSGIDADSRILTGTGSNISIANQASLYLKYDADGSRWNIVGGTGGGASTFTLLAGENLSVNDLVYISTGTGSDSGRNAGQLYKVDPSNDDRIEVAGFISAAAATGELAEVSASGILETFSGLTPGAIYFASTTPGAITTTPPSANGQWAISVGLATTATNFIINPVSSASAQYIQDSETSFTLANNQSVATDVTGLVLDPLMYRGFFIDYSIYRQTDTALSGAAQVGQLRAVYNSQAGTYRTSDDYAGDDAGITFSVTPSGQVQYKSTNITGANYVGTLKYTVRKTFNI